MCTVSERQMKNELNNVRLKAAPIKRINGLKVCKDGVEVLVLLNINAGRGSVLGKISAGEKAEMPTLKEDAGPHSAGATMQHLLDNWIKRRENLSWVLWF